MGHDEAVSDDELEKAAEPVAEIEVDGELEEDGEGETVPCGEKETNAEGVLLRVFLTVTVLLTEIRAVLEVVDDGVCDVVCLPDVDGDNVPITETLEEVVGDCVTEPEDVW